jgi:hypothetical protein
MKGAGNAITTNHYSYIDRDAYSLGSEQLFYRLDQVDYDGRRTSYRILAVNIADEDFAAYPIPVRKSSELHLILPWEGPVQVTVVDAIGNSIIDQQLIIDRSLKHLNIKIPEVSAGIYYLVCSSGKSLMRKKIVISD